MKKNKLVLMSVAALSLGAIMTPIALSTNNTQSKVDISNQVELGEDKYSRDNVGNVYNGRDDMDGGFVVDESSYSTHNTVSLSVKLSSRNDLGKNVNYSFGVIVNGDTANMQKRNQKLDDGDNFAFQVTGLAPATNNTLKLVM